MHKSILRFLSLVLVLGLVTVTIHSQLLAFENDQEQQPDAVVSESGAVELAREVEGSGLWVVRLNDPSLAAYEGNIAGLAPTSPRITGEPKLDINAPASVAYLNHLQNRQNQFAVQMNQALGRSVEIQFQYLNVINGLAVHVSAEEALALAELPGVAAVYRDTLRELDTDVSHDLIRSASIWDGDTSHSMATRGEGVIVGMLDTGVNPNHPSFAATDGDGYTHTNPFGAGNFVGVCDPGHPNHEDICNDKLIGAWNFHPSSPSAQDWNNHGSHVGSTIAGNRHEAVFTVGTDVFTRTVQGVAPRANVISYLVCFPTCPGTSSVAAVDQAIADGVDVLNYSITGVDNPWNDIVDLAFLEGFNAGIFIAASAGNDGPGASTVAKTGPWNASVAASTHNRIIANTLDATEPTPVPSSLVGMGAVPGTGPAITADIEAEIRFAGLVDPGNERGCNAFPPGVFSGSMALIQRGDCTFAVKVNNATAAGAMAVVVFNHLGGPPITMGGLEGTTIPAVFIDRGNGNELRDFIVANAPTPTSARINAGASVVTNDDWQDIMAGFSSRGPSQFEMLAPTFTAPGVNILAAGREVGGDPNQYVFLQGTSMSSPHGAGAGALLRALHPNWTPAEIRSALASTADTEGILKEDAETPADPFDMGSGRLNLDKAGRVGLVMDETHANFVAANPAIGGDPKTLNLPAMVNMACVETCSWTRTVKSVATVAATYTAVVDAPPGMAVTVDPPVFTLVPGTQNGATQQVEITVDVSGLPEGDWAFAEVRFETDAHHQDHGDFVQLAEATNLQSAWAQRSIDLSAYEGQEICLGFVYKGFDAHNWSVDDILVESDDGVHIDESFTDTTFPPPGWARYDFDGVGSQWLRTTAVFNTSPASARHSFSTSGGVVQHGWLVTPPFTLGENSSFTYFDHTGFPAWYMYSAVWLSTGSCDPTPTEGLPIAPVHYPIAVIPEIAAPAMTLDPAAITSVQGKDEVITHTLTIGNEGGTDLLWNVFEDDPTHSPRGATTPVETVSVPQTVTIGDAMLAGNRGMEVESGTTVVPEAAPTQAGLTTITHSASQAITAGNSVACSPDGGFTTTENGYLRTFTLEDFGIFSDFDVTEVSFGIENLSAVPQTLTVNLFTLDAMPFTYANMTLIGTASATFSPQSLTIVSVPVTGTAPEGSTLVVEVDAPNMSNVGGFFIGSNNAGQTAPSYIRSASCGLPEPTDLAAIGFPGMHIVMNVTGFAEAPPCEVPSGTPWVDVTPTSGAVAPDGQQEVSVIFDSTGLEAGELTANLCLESNDPNRPFAVVPLTLEVVEIPAIEVSPESLEATQLSGTISEQTLIISNVGEGLLEWDIEQAEAAPESVPPGTASTPVVLYDNGPLVTHPGAGPGGSDHSTLQNVSLGMLTLGFNAGLPNGFRMADDFTVTESGGWNVDTITFYAYQTGSTTTSSFTHVNYRIWDGVPGEPGSNLVFGDTTTNRLLSTDWINAYRISETTINTQRPIMHVIAEGGFHLAPGTYWVDWQLDGTIASGPWQPPVTITGQATTGNGLQFNPTTGLWAPANDTGTGTPQGLPFTIEGELADPHPCDTPTDISWLSVSPASGTTAAGESSDVTVTFDATGLAEGTHEALLCINSNDPANPRVDVPVTLNVTIYQKLVNAGGDLYIDGDGNAWVPDQVYSEGDWGYTRSQATSRSTNRTIGGTADQPKYQTIRQDPHEYRFDGLPPGTYEVRLFFAEIQNMRPGNRLFDVILNNTLVLPSYDIAATVGTFHADEYTFLIEVTDGQLRIRLVDRSGPTPIINAIGITQQP
jgi:subtilisin family serine protease